MKIKYHILILSFLIFGCSTNNSVKYNENVSDKNVVDPLPGSTKKEKPTPIYNQVSSEDHKIEYFINFSRLDENGIFEKKPDETFETSSGHHKIVLKRNSFTNSKDAKKYLFSRRTFLHQNYSQLIAPYFGVVKADDECMKLVDVSNNLEKKSKDFEYSIMKFVVNENDQLIDCYSEKPSSTVKYYLYHCKKDNRVFEVKVFRKLGYQEPSVNLTCY